MGLFYFFFFDKLIHMLETSHDGIAAWPAQLQKNPKPYVPSISMKMIKPIFELVREGLHFLLYQLYELVELLIKKLLILNQGCATPS